ncbi:hypothetical protein [Actinomadura sp. KC216]|uniref:hypothetical protein n=1 Tax=Actinomadura sp. KC216 TaxID=2530370 RepID=UPI001404C6C9|nr:hypothetical protein [Actinomadura sp. KC216]
MGQLFARFLEAHPGVESEIGMTPEEDAAWTAYSAGLLARHQAERSSLADQLEAEQNRP